MINLRKSTERTLQNSPFGHKRSLVGVIVLAILKTKLQVTKFGVSFFFVLSIVSYPIVCTLRPFIVTLLPPYKY